MRIKVLIILAFAALVPFCSGAKDRKVVFVIADGIPYDVIERLEPPVLYGMGREGGLCRAYTGGENGAYSETPTISAVGYNNILTGTWANKHNVRDNDISAPNYNYPNIFRLLKSHKKKSTTAVFSAWTDNRTKLVGSASPETGYFQPDYYYDGLENDTVNFPHDDKGEYFIRIDEAVTDSVSRIIMEKAPSLTWVYLEYTDEAGHRYGDGEEFDRAVMLADGQIGRIRDAVKYRRENFDEEWAVVVVTDHGRNATGMYHSWQTERERSCWIATDMGGLNERFSGGKAAIVDIMPTIAAYMGIKVPWDVKAEVDGVSLTGKISGDGMQAVRQGGRIAVKWDVYSPEGYAKVFVTDTNNFSTGGKDKYRLAAKVPVADGYAEIDAVPVPEDYFYKVVVEMPYNTLNKWIVPNSYYP